MSAPARPTAAELERHHCRVGHRFEPCGILLLCIDCGLLQEAKRYRNAQPYQTLVRYELGQQNTSGRPPCPGEVRT